MVSNSLSCLLTPHSEESYDEGVKDGPFLPFDGQKQPLSLSLFPRRTDAVVPVASFEHKN